MFISDKINSCFYCFLLSLPLWFSCFSTKEIGRIVLKTKYEELQISPQFLVWHFSKDSSRVYIKTEQESEWKIEYKYFADAEGKTLIDSVILNSTGLSFLKKDIFFFNIASQTGSKKLLEIKITDLKNNQNKADFVFIDRVNPYSRQHFIAMDVNENIPLFKNFVTDEKFTVHYFNPDHQKEMVSIKFFKNIFEPVPPVFFDRKMKKFNFIADSTFSISSIDTLVLENDGIYHFYIGENKDGWTLLRFQNNFPQITTTEKMAECLRYVSKNVEFEKIQKARDMKIQVDSFWLKLGKDKETAKLLIKEYYSRIQFANANFTSYKAGWQTDRGMVFVIYGKPDLVYKSTDSENWMYNKTATEAMTNFYFEKIENTFSDNHFYLKRNTRYEDSWNIATHKWRHGRINELIR